MIGSTELFIIAGIIILLFGATAIPKLARSLGRAKAELNKGLQEGAEEAEKKKDEKNTKD